MRILQRRLAWPLFNSSLGVVPQKIQSVWWEKWFKPRADA